MVCKHLQPLEDALIEAGIEETFRGQATPTFVENRPFGEHVEGLCLLCVEAYVTPGSAESGSSPEGGSTPAWNTMATTCISRLTGFATEDPPSRWMICRTRIHRTAETLQAAPLWSSASGGSPCAMWRAT